MGIENQLTNSRIGFYALSYSLKVWLSSVAIAPLLYFAADWIFINGRPQLYNILTLYPAIVIFEVMFSFVTWLLFWGMVTITGIHLHNQRFRKLIIYILAVLLAAGTSVLFFEPEIDFTTRDIIFWLGICNCLCIGAGCWFFRLGPKYISI